MEKRDYGFARTFPDLSYEDAIDKISANLKEEGFGILSEIDVQATLREKIDVDFKKYIILGACNPGLAHKALSNEEDLGLLLPCNVIVYEDNGGETVVEVVDPEAMFKLVDNPELDSIAAEVQQSMKNALDKM